MVCVGFGIVRGQKLKIGDIKGMEIHILRAKKSRSNPDIDADKTPNNYAIIEIGEGELNDRVARRIEELPGQRTKKGKIRKIQANAVRMYDFIVTGTHEDIVTMSEDEQKKYFDDVVNFFKRKFGEKNVMYAVVHNDERTPHLHLGLVPEFKGKLAAYQLFTPQSMRNLQNEFWEQVSRHYGLERGELVDEDEDKPKRKHKTAVELKSETLAEVSQKKEELLKVIGEVADAERVRQSVLTKKQQTEQDLISLNSSLSVTKENLARVKDDVADAERQRQNQKEELQRLKAEQKQADKLLEETIDLYRRGKTRIEVMTETETKLKKDVAQLRTTKDFLEEKNNEMLSWQRQILADNKKYEAELDEKYEKVKKAEQIINEAENAKLDLRLLQTQITSARAEFEELEENKEQSIQIISQIAEPILEVSSAIDTRSQNKVWSAIQNLVKAFKSIAEHIPFFRLMQDNQQLIINQNFGKAYQNLIEAEPELSPMESGVKLLRSVIRMHGTNNQIITDAIRAVANVERANPEFEIRLLEKIHNTSEYQFQQTINGLRNAKNKDGWRN